MSYFQPSFILLLFIQFLLCAQQRRSSICREWKSGHSYSAYTFALDEAKMKQPLYANLRLIFPLFLLLSFSTTMCAIVHFWCHYFFHNICFWQKYAKRIRWADYKYILHWTITVIYDNRSIQRTHERTRIQEKTSTGTTKWRTAENRNVCDKLKMKKKKKLHVFVCEHDSVEARFAVVVDQIFYYTRLWRTIALFFG